MTRTDRILDLMAAADSTGTGVREAIAATNPGEDHVTATVQPKYAEQP
jgi:hypothetical protein